MSSALPLLPASQHRVDLRVVAHVARLDEVDPNCVASGRTRFSISISTELKPIVAPWAWSAWAMPQAIEWSFATPKMSAFRPSSSPTLIAYGAYGQAAAYQPAFAAPCSWRPSSR